MPRRFTTPIELPGNPTGPLEAAPRQYVDAADALKADSVHVHAAGDVTSGTFAIARIPTGTTSTTVSLGNHSHAASAITSGVFAVARLPIVLNTIQTASVADGATHTTTASSGSYVDLTLSGATASIGVPTSGVNRQTLEYVMYSASGCTVTFNSSIRLSTGLTSRSFSVTGGQVLLASLKYTTIASLNVWVLVAAAVSAT